MMGKQAEDIFRLDISAGITPFVGFCIALTVFDSKFI